MVTESQSVIAWGVRDLFWGNRNVVDHGCGSVSHDCIHLPKLTESYTYNQCLLYINSVSNFFDLNFF